MADVQPDDIHHPPESSQQVTSKIPTTKPAKKTKRVAVSKANNNIDFIFTIFERPL